MMGTSCALGTRYCVLQLPLQGMGFIYRLWADSRKWMSSSTGSRWYPFSHSRAISLHEIALYRAITVTLFTPEFECDDSSIESYFTEHYFELVETETRDPTMPYFTSGPWQTNFTRRRRRGRHE